MNDRGKVFSSLYQNFNKLYSLRSDFWFSSSLFYILISGLCYSDINMVSLLLKSTFFRYINKNNYKILYKKNNEVKEKY